MKILYLANARLPTDNAHGVQIVKTCEALAKAGAHVTLLRPWRINPHKGDIYEYYRVEHNFSIVTLPSADTLWLGRIGFWFQNVTFGLTALLYLLAHSFDIVYSRDELPLFFASLVSRKTYWESHTGRHNALVARLLGRVSGLVVITQGLKDLYAGKGVPAQKILVAPDAVSLEDFAVTETKEEARLRLGLPQDKKIALYVGKLDGWKGVETLCAASMYLPDDIRIAVIGGEPEEIAKLKKDAPRVTFLGWRPYRELPDNQAAADVLVLPNSGKSEVSARFTSPLKLFTYLAAGKPIVASDLPSIREVLDEHSAFFFAPDDAEDCARVIREALGNEAVATEKVRIAREYALRYTWKARGKRILGFIHD